MIINLKSKRAFTLLEISIVILIIGILIVGTINFQLTINNKSKENITIDRIAAIEKAINGYVLEYGKLPCPAIITLDKNDQNYAKEIRSETDKCTYNSNFVSNDIIYGAVPTRTLGLTDDYMVDGWNNTINYVISKKYGDEKIYLAGNANTITMKNIEGKDITDQAIYVVISSGKNKNGAFRNGSQISEPNSDLSDAQNAFSKNFSDTFKKDVQTDTFDDIVAFKDKNMIIMKENMQFVTPCSLKDFSDDEDWNYDTYSGCNNGLCPQGAIILAKNSCHNNEVSKNPSNLENSRKPMRKCLKYGKWSDVIYPCVESCSEDNIDNIQLGTKTAVQATELRNVININYLKRAAVNETIELECLGNKVGYIKLKCNKNDKGYYWTYIGGDCYDREKNVKSCQNSELNSNENNFHFSLTTGTTESSSSVEGTCADGYFAQTDTSVVATCQADGTWSYTGSCLTVCDLNDLRRDPNDNTNEAVAISAKAPGVPGSKFRQNFFLNDSSFTGNIKSGEVYDKRYFTSGTVLDATCFNDGKVEHGYYTETALDGQITISEFGGLHAYKCLNGEWKRGGSCISDCSNANLEYAHIASFNVGTDLTTDYGKIRIGVYENGYSGPLIAAICERNDEGSVWSYRKVCDKYALKANNDNMDKHVISTAPGVPGSMFILPDGKGFDSVNLSTNTSQYDGAKIYDYGNDKKRYFTDGALLEAACDTGYTEVAINGEVQITNNWGKHLYKCEEGVWKRAGNCAPDCDNSVLTYSATTFSTQDGATAYNETQIGTRDGADGPVIATCQVDGTWNYEGVCDLNDLKAGGETIAISTKSPGVPGSKFREGFFYENGTFKKNYVDGTFYSNRYFANGAKVDAACYDSNVNYVEVPFGSPYSDFELPSTVPSGQKKFYPHAYECQNGQWKRAGGCFDKRLGCIGDPTISNQLLQLSSDTNNNTSTLGLYQNKNYYELNSIINTTCVTGYSEICQDSNNEASCYANTKNGSAKLNTWLQCENGAWVQHGSCSVTTCSNAELANISNTTFSITTGTTNYNGTQTGTCNSGYSPTSGSNIIATCQLDGTWSYSGSCRSENVCDKNDLSLVANSHLSPSNEDSQPISGTLYANGALLDATCNSGYVESADNGDIQGTWKSHAYKCVDGQWKTMGSCAPVNCSSEQIIQEMENNHMVLECVNNSCWFVECNTGYSQVGNWVGYTCSNGNWVKNGSIQCKIDGNFCDINDIYAKLGDTMNLTLDGTQYIINGSMHNSSSYTDGTMIDAHCNSSSQYDEVATGGEITNEWDKLLAFKCVNREWKRMGSCVRKCENTNLSYDNASFSSMTGTTNYNGTQTGTCNSGYSPTSGSGITATCQADGSWSYSGSCTKEIEVTYIAINGTSGSLSKIFAEGESVTCGVNAFGSDPASGVLKMCKIGNTIVGYEGDEFTVSSNPTTTNKCIPYFMISNVGSSNLANTNYSSYSSPTGQQTIYNNGSSFKGTNNNGSAISCNTGYFGSPTITCSNGNWSFSGSCVQVCDKATLRSGNTDNIISTTPGVPGSKFWQNYSNATTSGTTYENGQYFADGAIVDACCVNQNTDYYELAVGGQIDSTWGSHAYKCDKGTWKRMGTCFQGCQGKPSNPASSTHLLISSNTNNSAPEYINTDNTQYYSNGSTIDTDCEQGYSEFCENNNSNCKEPRNNRTWYTWLQCENNSWVQKGECKKKCKVTGVPDNGYWTYENGDTEVPKNTEVEHGEKLKQVCSSGYASTGDYVVECNNGVWNIVSNTGTCKTTCYYESPNTGYWVNYDDNSALGNGKRSGYVPYGTKIKLVCNSGYALIGSSIGVCKKGDAGISDTVNGWDWISSDGECGCEGGYYVKSALYVSNYYITHCSNSNATGTVKCAVDDTERYGNMRIGQISQTSVRGSYKNIKINDTWVSDDTGLCYIKVRCDSDGVVRSVRDNFNTGNFNTSEAWTSNCQYDRSNDYMNAVCCNE